MHSVILAAGHGSVTGDLKGILNWASHSVFLLGTIAILGILTIRTAAKGWHVLVAFTMGAFAVINIPQISNWVHKVNGSGSTIGTVGLSLGMVAFMVGVLIFVLLVSREG